MQTVRRRQLALAVAERGFLRVTDAALEFAVSEVTLRSDLAALEADGAIVRVHGGAMPVLSAGESSFETAVERRAAEKRAIGRAAAALVSSGQSVLLDVGSTALAVARALVARTDLVDVHVITNGLTIALALEAAMPRFEVVVTGGTLRPLQHSLVNPFAGLLLESLHTDIAFIGCTGVHAEHGVTNVNLPEAEVKRAMVNATERAIIIADASKLGVAGFGRVAPLDAFERLITAAAGDSARDTLLDTLRDTLRDLERAGLDVSDCAVSASVN
jgi:DeoR family transcriptional regulator, aga operon transcriptional repressor